MYRILLLTGLVLVLASSCKEAQKDLEWTNLGQDAQEAIVRVPSRGDAPLLQAVKSSMTNVLFQNHATRASIIENENVLNGSGVALGDVNGDGLVDVYLSGMDVDNKLYLNRGNWSFEDITDSAGVACANIRSTGTAMVDGDNDGDLDLFIATLGEGLIHFVNDGAGIFSRNGLPAFDIPNGSSSMAFSDFDRDGDLDLYLANYKYKSLRDSLDARVISNENLVLVDNQGNRSIKAGFSEHYEVNLVNDGTKTIEQLFEVGEQDILYINNGDNKWEKAEVSTYFRNANGQPLTELTKGWGLSVQFRDMNGDGWSDIYVCNDYETPDNYWISNEGVFEEIDPLALRHGSNSSMSVDFSDLNHDGELDFFISEMLSTKHTRRKTQMGVMTATPISIGEYKDFPQYMRNNLYMNRGDGTYAETARLSGVSSSEWSWSSIFKDIDLDGDDDLVITSGHEYDFMDSDAQAAIQRKGNTTLAAFKESRFDYPPLELNNLVFENKGDMHFELLEMESGFGSEQDVSHGMAMADLDNDGDLDIVINRWNRPAEIYKNTADNYRIGIQLQRSEKNPTIIGSRINVRIDGQKDQSRTVVAGGRYLSADSFEKEFAAFSKDALIDIEVEWPNGEVSNWTGKKSNRKYILSDVNASKKEDRTQSIESPLFTAFEGMFDHQHTESPFNDFVVQSLLPNRLSQFGPGVAIADINNDGFEDITITEGRKGRLRQFINQNGKGFSEIKSNTINNVDQLGVVVIPKEKNRVETIVTNVNLEATEKSPSTIASIQSAKRETTEVGMDMTGGISAADYDGDGDLDLFVQGRATPYMYPSPASSYFFKQENGVWVKDGLNSYKMKAFGMVTGSVFSDMDQDGDPDLILSTEWGAINYLENVNGEFNNVTESKGLADKLGWWNGLTVGDVNNDGQLDIIATNWGLNSKYHIKNDEPLQLFFDDFDNNRIIDVVEAHYDEDFGDIVPERGFSCMSNAMPFIAEEKGTFKNYATSDLNEIMGSRMAKAEKLEVNELRSGVFINKDGRFEFQPLSMEAQLTTAMAPVVFDADGDGNMDILLSQNFFAVQRETDRNDAGRGLLLLGDGNGAFKPIKGQASGVMVYGEQRGAAYGDFNGDHKPDIIITQNGAESVILNNNSDKPYARIRVKSIDTSQTTVGTQIRVQYKDGSYGPTQELKIGEGFLSQNSKDFYLGRLSDIGVVEVYRKGKKVRTVNKIDQGLNIIEI